MLEVTASLHDIITELYWPVFPAAEWFPWELSMPVYILLNMCFKCPNELLMCLYICISVYFLLCFSKYCKTIQPGSRRLQGIYIAACVEEDV